MGFIETHFFVFRFATEAHSRPKIGFASPHIPKYASARKAAIFSTRLARFYNIKLIPSR